MAKRILPLTDKEIKNAKPKEKSYKIFDGQGLYLEILPSGKKSWKIKYTFEKKEKKYTIGYYPTFSLKNAREKLKEIKMLLSNNKDPNEIKKEAKNKKNKISLTFEETVDKWAKIIENELASNTFFNILKRFDNYVYPYIGKKEIDKISKPDLIELIEKMKNVKTQTSRKGDRSYTIRRIWNDIKRVFLFAFQNDLIETDITQKIDINAFVPKPQKLNQMKAILDENELRKLVNALEEYPNEVTALALKMLMLTALRVGNIRDLEWTWIDWNKKIIVFPTEKMKTRKEFRLPITQKILTILKRMKEITYGKSSYVFCSPIAPTKKMSENTLNFAHKRIGFDNHNAHGWRSSFSTICYENQKKHGFSSEIIESQLAHVIGNEVTRAYMRSDFLEERKKLLEWWSEFLEDN